MHPLKLNAACVYELLSFSHFGKFFLAFSGTSFTELYNKKYILYASKNLLSSLRSHKWHCTISLAVEYLWLHLI